MASADEQCDLDAGDVSRLLWLLHRLSSLFSHMDGVRFITLENKRQFVKTDFFAWAALLS
jgi:hypothetical protein